MATRPSPEPTRNKAERRAKADELAARRAGTAKKEQQQAAAAARRLERKHGLKRPK